MSASRPGDGIWIRVRHVVPAQEDGIRIDLFSHGDTRGAIEDERGLQQIWEEGSSGHRRVNRSTSGTHESGGSYWAAVRRSQQLLLRSAAMLASCGTASAAPGSGMGRPPPIPIPMHSPSNASNNPSNSRPSLSSRYMTHLDAIQIIRRAHARSYADRARTAAAAMAAATPIEPPGPRMPLWRPPGAASLPSSPAATASGHAPPTPAAAPPAHTTPRPPPLLGRLHLDALPAALPVPMGASSLRARRTSIRVKRLMLAAKQQRHGRALTKAPAASHPSPPHTAPPDYPHTPVYLPGKAWAGWPVEAASGSRPGSGAATPAYVPVHQPTASKGLVERSSGGRRSIQGHQEGAGAEQEEGQLGPRSPDSKKVVRRKLLKELRTAAGDQPQPMLGVGGPIREEVDGEQRLQRPGPVAAGVLGSAGSAAAAAAAGPAPAAGQRGSQSRLGAAGTAGPSYSSPTASSLQRRTPAADRQRRARPDSQQRQVEQPGQRRAAERPAAALGAVLGGDALPESTQRLRDHIRLLRATARAKGGKGPAPAGASGGHAGAGSAQGAALLPELDAGRRSQQLAMVATLAAATAFGMAAAALRDPDRADSAAPPPPPEERQSPAPLALTGTHTSLPRPHPWGAVGVSGLPKLKKREPGQPLALNPLPFEACPLMHVSVSGNMVVDVSDTLELTVPLQIEVDFEVSQALLAELHAAAERSLPVT